MHERREHFNRGRFPRTVGAEESEDTALLHREGHVLHRDKVAELPCQILYLNDIRHVLLTIIPHELSFYFFSPRFTVV